MSELERLQKEKRKIQNRINKIKRKEKEKKDFKESLDYYNRNQSIYNLKEFIKSNIRSDHIMIQEGIVSIIFFNPMVDISTKLLEFKLHIHKNEKFKKILERYVSKLYFSTRDDSCKIVFSQIKVSNKLEIIEDVKIFNFIDIKGVKM